MFNKKRVLTIFALFILLSIPIATALETELVIKTKRPNYGIVVRVLDASNTDQVVDSVYGTTEPTGDGRITYSTSRPELAFRVMLINNGLIKEEKLFEGPYTIAPEIELYFYDPDQTTNTDTPTGDDPDSDINGTTDDSPDDTNSTQDSDNNETDTNITTDTNPNGNGTNTITGNAILDENFGTSQFGYYLIAAVVIAGIIGMFLLRKFKSANKNSDKYIPPATSEFLGSSNRTSSRPEVKQAKEEAQQELAETRKLSRGAERDEKRIQRLQREIELLKKKERLREAEEEYEETERELRRLHKEKAEEEKRLKEERRE